MLAPPLAAPPPPPTPLAPTPAPVLPPRQTDTEHPPMTPGRLPPSNPSLPILHYHPLRYAVVNKPADVRMDGHFTHTVEKLLLAHLAELPCSGLDDGSPAARAPGFGLRFVHRLDYATSGVLLVALAKIPAAVVAAQFEARSVEKRYVALVHGHVHTPAPGAALLFDQPIADTIPKGFRMQVGEKGNEGRAAVTRCVPLAWGTYRTVPVTKVRLMPESGRRHQLRLHCAHAGMPIVGDATYGGEEVGGGVPPRMMLHAEVLCVRLPGAVLRGRKSGLREAVPRRFVADDPLVVGGLEGLVLHEEAVVTP